MIACNAVTPTHGSCIGAAVLVTYAPDPRQLVYIALMVLSGVEALILFYMPETAVPRAGALSSLRPHVSIPPQARGTLARVTPVIIASWALGGFYFSLMPTLVRVATGATLPIVGGLVVGALTLSGALAVLALRPVSASSALSGGIVALASGVAVTLLGVHAQLASIMLVGTVVAGVGFGATFAGTMRTVLPLAEVDQRAALLSVFYVVDYLSFSLPAILAGCLAPVVGLTTVAKFYGGTVIVMALTSMAATLLARNSQKLE